MGFDAIDATDISPEMLAVADGKSIYRKCFEGDILVGLDVPANSYLGIVSSGTFTLGHVGPEGLDEVFRILAPGGLAVIAVRDAHYEQAGFATKLEQLETSTSEVFVKKRRIYSDANKSQHCEDLALIVHIRSL